MKTVPLSVRISHEDSEFISKLNIEGATTPSDKIRAIISEKKKLELEGEEHSEVLDRIEQLLRPVSRNLKQVQFEQNIYSQSIEPTKDTLIDLLVYFLTEGGKVNDHESLVNFEDHLSEQVFRMFEASLQAKTLARLSSEKRNEYEERFIRCQHLIEFFKNQAEH